MEIKHVEFLAPVITGVLVLIAWVTPEFIFKSKDTEIIAAILIGIFTQVSQLFISINRNKTHTELTISMHIKKIVEMLKVHNDYFDNNWLFSVFNKIVNIIRLSENKPHDLHRVKEIIDNALMNSVKIIGEKYEINILSGEMERIVTLNEAVQRAQNYIFAITVDKNNYFENFWQDINKEYINLNVQAAKRGVKIERIFIMSSDSFNPKTIKGKKFSQLAKNLKLGGKNMKIFRADIENFPNIDQLNSLFICDDVMASEASKNENENGYVIYNDVTLVNKLMTQFQSIKYRATEI